MKTMRDTLRSMLADRWEENKMNVNSSGIEEVIGPMGHLLDHVLLEIHETEEALERKRDEVTERA